MMTARLELPVVPGLVATTLEHGASDPTVHMVVDGQVPRHLGWMDRPQPVHQDEAASLDVLAEAVSTLGRALSVSRAYYGEIDDAEGVVDIVMEWTRDVPSLRGRHPIDVRGDIFQAMLRDSASVVEDMALVEDDPAQRELHRANRNLAWVAVPLIRSGRAVAVVGVSNDAPRSFSDADVALVRETGERTWNALAQAGVLRRLRESQAGMNARAGHEPFFRTVSDAIREDRDDQSILFKVIALLVDHFGVTSASASEVDPRDPLLHYVYYYAAAGPNENVVQRVVMPPASAIYQRYIEGGLPLVCRDAVDEMDRSLSAFLESWGSRGLISVPMIKDGRVAFILGIQSTVPRDWSESDVRLVRDLADLAWTAVRRVRAEAALAERERTQALLIGWNDDVRDAADPEQVIDKTLATLEAAFPAFSVTYSELDPGGTILRNIHVREHGMVRIEPEEFPMTALGPSPLVRFDEEATIAVDDVATDPRMPPESRAIYHRYGVTAVLVAPIYDSGRAVGLLGVQAATPHRWAKGQRQLLRDVADRVWAELTRVRAEAALTERERSQTFLIEWNDAIRDETDPEQVIADTLERLGDRFEPHNVSFSELDADGVMLSRVRMWHAGVVYRDGRRVPIAAFGPMLVREFADRSIVTVDDTMDDPRLPIADQALWREYGIRSVITAPVRDRDRIVALLAMHYDRPRNWSAAEQGVLRDLADRVWSKVERTRAEIALSRSREALAQAEKMASLGAVLSGISHELNNPLAIVTAQAQVMIHLAKGTDLANRAQQIREAADRCARIIQNFSAMARQTPTLRRRVALGEMIDAATRQIADSYAGDNIVLRTRVAADAPDVVVDPDQIHQILVNLLVNARQAVGEQDGASRHVTISAGLSDASDAFVDVQDSGPGIAPEARERLFEPFFTTKPVGQGSGMGLAIAQGIAELHAGALVAMPSDAGARFRLTLPAVDVR